MYWNYEKGKMTVAVENAETSGSVLLIYFPQPHPEISKLTAAPILPSQIAACIKAAVAKGWKSDESGSAFHFSSLK